MFASATSRARGVEKVDEEEREDDGRQPESQCRTEIERTDQAFGHDRKRDDPMRESGERDERFVRTDVDGSARDDRDQR